MLTQLQNKPVRNVPDQSKKNPSFSIYPPPPHDISDCNQTTHLQNKQVRTDPDQSNEKQNSSIHSFHDSCHNNAHFDVHSTKQTKFVLRK